MESVVVLGGGEVSVIFVSEVGKNFSERCEKMVFSVL